MEPSMKVKLKDGSTDEISIENESGKPIESKKFHFSTPKAKLIEAATISILDNLQHYPKAKKAFDIIREDAEALAHWDMANYITMIKLGYNDHGRVHAFLTAASAVTITHLLLKANVKPDIIDSNSGDEDDVFLAILLGTILHDIGNQIHRNGHEAHGVSLAIPLIDRITKQIYSNETTRIKIRSFILSAINCHDLNPPPLTIEASITAVADGTDITKGRGRKAFKLGSVDIHSISALAVNKVIIEKGRHKPVKISVTMNNSGGIFQVEEVLSSKIIGTPLRDYIELSAYVQEGGETRILDKVRLSGNQFVIDLDKEEAEKIQNS